MELSDEQQAAIARCLDFTYENRTLCVSGGPGRGKTTILKWAYEAARDAGYTPVLACPTGKGARRITEATGIQALTLHKLLEYPKPGEKDDKGVPLYVGAPRRSKSNPFSYDVIFIDEASMINEELHTATINAMPKGGYLRLFGDADQLPPVEDKKNEEDPNYISPFVRLIQKNGVVLTTCFRQAEGSAIISNAERIIRGFVPIPASDFHVHQPHDAASLLTKLMKEDAAGRRLFASYNGQIISPMRIKPYGALALSTLAKGIYNPRVDATLERTKYHPYSKVGVKVGIGDKLMMTQNNYNIPPEGIMNGEVGTLTDVREDGTLVMEIDDKEYFIPKMIEVDGRYGNKIPTYPQHDLDLAYVVTTHKTQGSEYDEVVVLLDRSQSYVLYRNNFYTAVTRAKRVVHVIASTGAMPSALAEMPWGKRKRLENINKAGTAL